MNHPSDDVMKMMINEPKVLHACQGSTKEYKVQHMCASKAHEIIMQKSVGRLITRDINPC